MTDCIQVMTTVEARQQAERIAETLLAARLAACVQVVGPVTSYFRWRGKNETATELLCLIKTRRDLYPRVEAAIRQLHPYEVPEILAVAVETGGADYLAWLAGEVAGGGEAP